MEAINERPIRDWRLMSSVRQWVMNVYFPPAKLFYFKSGLYPPLEPGHQTPSQFTSTSVLGPDLWVSRRRNVQRKYIVHFPLFIFFGIPLRNAYSRKITILYIRKHFGNKSFKLEPSVIDWEDFSPRLRKCEIHCGVIFLYWSRLSSLFVGRL